MAAPESSEPRTGRRGLVVSDLHLFAQRSNGLDCFDSLRGELDSVSILVLNGDTFDFRWSALSSQQATIKAALDWLRGLLRDFPNCTIHFVVGNHDCLTQFQTSLADLAATSSNLHCHEYLLEIEASLFVHGDCANAKMTHHDLGRYRSAWKSHRQKGALGSMAYRFSDQVGLTQFLHDWHFPKHKTLARITHYLDDAQPNWRSSIRRCYFGHTHLPFSDHEHEGVRFYNTGSAIRGMEFNPQFFELEQTSH